MLSSVMYAVDSLKDRLVANVQELVRIDSTNPGRFEADVAAAFASQLSSFGIQHRVIESAPLRANVLASLGPGASGGLLFNGHLDVVPTGDVSKWTRHPFAADIWNGRIYGRGSTDMKGAVVAFSIAMAAVANCGVELKKPVYLHAVADEECGGRFGTQFIVQNGLLPNVDLAVVGEASTYNGEICLVRACTGIGSIRLESFGKSSHASRPYEGNNANLNMARVLLAIRDNFKLPADTPDPLMPAPTIAPGTVIKGGIKTNVIPDYCEAYCDIRVVPGMTQDSVAEQLQQIIDTVRARHPETNVRFTIESWDPPTLVQPDSPAIKRVEQAAERVLGRAIEHRKRSGTTDARFINEAGIPCVVAFGPGDMVIGNMHGIDESVGIDELVKFAKIYAALILEVCA